MSPLQDRRRAISNHLNRLAILSVLLPMTLLGGTATADDWPQWRGEHRDGVWRETGVVSKLPAGDLPITWRVKIGPGYSGPSVADGRVFITDRPDGPKQQERVLCFDAKTGKPLWTHAYDCVYKGVGYVAGPRANVTVDGPRAYALGTMGHLHCHDAATGEVQWKKDLDTQYKIRMPIWGIAAAPLVYQNLLIVQVGGSDGACVVAFDKLTGKEIWRALDDRASYSAPVLIEQAGQPVLVMWTGDHVAGLDPLKGTVHWKHEFKPSRMVINISTPVIDGDRLFVTAFYDGSLLLKLDQKKLAVEQVWRRKGPDERMTDSLHSIISTPLIQGDYVYGVDSYGELRCLDIKTGDRVWEDRTATPRNRWSNIHMVRQGEDIWMFNEAGELIISRLSPKGFEEKSRAKLIKPTKVQLARREGVCWSHPAFANKHVFIRNDEELVCASLAAE